MFVVLFLICWFQGYAFFIKQSVDCWILLHFFGFMQDQYFFIMCLIDFIREALEFSLLAGFKSQIQFLCCFQFHFFIFPLIFISFFLLRFALICLFQNRSWQTKICGLYLARHLFCVACKLRMIFIFLNREKE